MAKNHPKNDQSNLSTGLPISVEDSGKGQHNPRRLKEVSIDRALKQIKNILGRQVEHLLDESYAHTLERSQIEALTLCLKAFNEFKKEEDKDLEAMTDEELTELANKNKDVEC